MHKALLLTASLWVTVVALGQATPDTLAIRQVLQHQQDAWNKGDINAFMTGYWKSDSLLFTGSSGPTYGWQTTLDGYKKRYDSPAKMGQLQFTVLELRMLGPDHAMLLGKWHLTRTVGDVGGYFTLIWKKISGQWKIVADHTS